FVMIPATAGLVLFAEPLVTLLFTSKYSAAAGVLSVFAFTYVLLIVPFDMVARADGDAKWILKARVSISAVALAVCGILTVLFGAFGALAGALAVRLLMAGVALRYGARRLAVPLRQLVPRELIHFTAYALVSCAAAWACADAMGGGTVWLFGG